MKGYTATLYCRVEPPGQKVIWVAGFQSVDLKVDPRYSGRAKYSYDYKWTRYMMNISDVRWSDSAEYHCRVPAKQPDTDWTPGVSLLVTGATRCLHGVLWEGSANSEMMSLLLFHLCRRPGEGACGLISPGHASVSQQMSTIDIRFLRLVWKWKGSSWGNVFNLDGFSREWIQLFLRCCGTAEVCFSSSV